MGRSSFNSNLISFINQGINLQKSDIEKEILLVVLFLFSLTTPIGIILGIVLSGISVILEGIFLAISAGIFLYISASEVIIEEFSVSRYKIQKFIGFVTGFGIIAFFTIFEFSH
jgi:zinc transporter ZupT